MLVTALPPKKATGAVPSSSSPATPRDAHGDCIKRTDAGNTIAAGGPGRPHTGGCPRPPSSAPGYRSSTHCRLKPEAGEHGSRSTYGRQPVARRARLDGISQNFLSAFVWLLLSGALDASGLHRSAREKVRKQVSRIRTRSDLPAATLPAGRSLSHSSMSGRVFIAMPAFPSPRIRVPLAARIEVAPGVLAEAVDAEAARELQRGVFGCSEIGSDLVDHPRNLRA